MAGMKVLFKNLRLSIVVVGCVAAIGFAGGALSEEALAPDDADAANVAWINLAKVRAKQRWEALIAGRFEDAYSFLSPVQRKVVSYDAYRRGIYGYGVWTAAEVENATCDDVRCVVATRVHVNLAHPRLAKPIVSNELIEEAWIKDAENTQLWFVPNK
jgi:hypothetical protein